MSNNPTNKCEIMNCGVISHMENLCQVAQPVVKSMGSSINWAGLKFQCFHSLPMYLKRTYLFCVLIYKTVHRAHKIVVIK